MLYCTSEDLSLTSSTCTYMWVFKLQFYLSPLDSLPGFHLPIEDILSYRHTAVTGQDNGPLSYIWRFLLRILKYWIYGEKSLQSLYQPALVHFTRFKTRYWRCQVELKSVLKSLEHSLTTLALWGLIFSVAAVLFCVAQLSMLDTIAVIATKFAISTRWIRSDGVILDFRTCI